MPRPHEAHRASAPASLRVGVLTVSDSRTEATDDSGTLIRSKLLGAKHAVPFYRIVRDDAGAIDGAIDEALPVCDAVITTGGTGLGRRDVTVATLARRFDRTLPGFGELFRALSFKDIGSAAMLSDAAAGVIRGKIVFCLPGSPAACALAMDALILPELPHAVGVMTR